MTNLTRIIETRAGKIEVTYAEMIETLVDRKTDGAFGKYVDLSEVKTGLCRVELLNDEGKVDMVVLVRHGGYGWVVSYCGVEYIDRDLREAAHAAVEAKREQAGRNVVTRNVKVYLHA